MTISMTFSGGSLACELPGISKRTIVEAAYKDHGNKKLNDERPRSSENMETHSNTRNSQEDKESRLRFGKKNMRRQEGLQEMQKGPQEEKLPAHCAKLAETTENEVHAQKEPMMIWWKSTCDNAQLLW